MSDPTVSEVVRRWRAQDRYIELSPSDLDGLIEMVEAEAEVRRSLQAQVRAQNVELERIRTERQEIISQRQQARGERDEVRAMLLILADASENYALSEPDMPSHDATEDAFDVALFSARHIYKETEHRSAGLETGE